MNPISDTLHDLVTSDEKAFRAAHRGRGIDLEPRARRARRVRIASRAGVATASAVILAVSAVAVSSALSGEAPDTDPATIPIPDGYERIVIPLDTNLGVEYPSQWSSSVFGEMGFGDSLCGQPLPTLDDSSEPFHLKVTSVDPIWVGNPPAEGEWVPTELNVNSTLTYDGTSAGAVESSTGAWALLREDGTVVSSTWGGPFDTTTFGPLAIYSLEAPFSTPQAGPVFLLDCETAYDLLFDPANPPDEVMLDPGTYSIVAIAEVKWSAVGTVLLNADEIGLDPSWFLEGWQDAIPCQEALAEAKSIHDGKPFECVPNLHYQVVSALGEYAVVDVPSEFLDGPRKTWYVVSDPYPIELPLPPAEPTT